jgi:hypothetical protein
MGSILAALAALVVSIGLIIGGTRFSTYLFVQSTERTRRFAQHRPVTGEMRSQDSEYRVERPMYYEAMDTGGGSARYARSSLMVIALILLLTIVATISILAGPFH